METIRTPRVPAPFLVALVAALAHLTTLSGGFVFDDAAAIVRNPLAQWPPDLAGIFSRPYWGALPGYELQGLWRPLVTLSFALTDGLFGASPLAHRALDLGLFALLAALVTVLALRVLQSRGAALLAGLLFAVHPVVTESIAIAANRTELLCAVLYVGGLLALLRASAGDARAGALAVVLYAGALLSKESGITFLGAAVLVELLHRAQGRARGTLRLRLWVLGALLVVTVAYLGARVALIPAPFGEATSWVDNTVRTGGLASRVMTPLVVMLLAAESLVLPLRLTTDYTWAVVPPADLGTPAAWAGLVVLAGLVALAALLWRRRPALAFAAGLFLVTWSLASNLVLVTTILFADRLLTLPLVPFCLGVAAAAWPAIERLRGASRVGALSGVALVLALLAARSLTWGAAFVDERTLFARSLEARPASARLLGNLGGVLLREGDTAGAREALHEALRVHPEAVEPRVTLASLLAKEGEKDEAIRLVREAIELRPRYGVAENNLCALLLEAGRPAEALPTCEAAVSHRPDVAAAWANLGGTLSALGRTDEARAALDRALLVDPSDPTALNRMGAHLVAVSDDAALLPVLLRLARLQPADAALSGDIAAVALRLAERAMRQGRGADAAAMLEEAFRAAPHHGELAYQRAVVALVGGQPARAAEWAERAARAGFAVPDAFRRALAGRR